MFKLKVTANNFNDKLHFVTHVYKTKFNTVERAYRYALKVAHLKCKNYNEKQGRAFCEVVENGGSLELGFDFIHPHSVLVLARDRLKEVTGTLCSCYDVVDENGDVCDVSPYITGGNKS